MSDLQVIAWRIFLIVLVLGIKVQCHHAGSTVERQLAGSDAEGVWYYVVRDGADIENLDDSDVFYCVYVAAIEDQLREFSSEADATAFARPTAGRFRPKLYRVAGAGIDHELQKMLEHGEPPKFYLPPASWSAETKNDAPPSLEENLGYSFAEVIVAEKLEGGNRGVIAIPSEGVIVLKEEAPIGFTNGTGWSRFWGGGFRGEHFGPVSFAPELVFDWGEWRDSIDWGEVTQVLDPRDGLLPPGTLFAGGVPDRINIRDIVGEPKIPITELVDRWVTDESLSGVVNGRLQDRFDEESMAYAAWKWGEIRRRFKEPEMATLESSYLKVFGGRREDDEFDQRRYARQQIGKLEKVSPQVPEGEVFIFLEGKIGEYDFAEKGFPLSVDPWTPELAHDYGLRFEHSWNCKWHYALEQGSGNERLGLQKRDVSSLASGGKKPGELKGFLRVDAGAAEYIRKNAAERLHKAARVYCMVHGEIVGVATDLTKFRVEMKGISFWLLNKKEGYLERVVEFVAPKDVFDKHAFKEDS